LRCPADEPPPPSIFDRIKCCIGDLGEANRKSFEFERSQSQIAKAQFAANAHAKNATLEFSAQDAQRVIGAEERLKPMVARKSETPDADTLDEHKLRASLDELYATGAATARFLSLPQASRDELVEQHGERLAQAIQANESLLKEAAARLAEDADRLLSSPLERSLARAAADATIRFVDPQLDPAERSTPAAYAYSLQAASSVNSNALLSQALSDFKSWLLRKLDECPPLGECCLADEIKSIVIPSDSQFNEATALAVDQLLRAFLKYLLDCICSALLPPCPPCDDLAVKLACLDVIDCKVDNICNLERTFLLTENNLRYWIPFLHQFGELLERICCELSKRLDKRTFVSDQSNITVDLARQPGYFAGTANVTAAPSLKEGLANIGRLVSSASESVKPLVQPERLFAPFGEFASVDAIGKLMSPGSKPSEREVPLGAERGVVTDERLDEIEREVENRVTLRGLGSTSVIRRLNKALEKQEELIGQQNAELASQIERNDALERRLSALEEGR
ncbi:MAG: hypothetical protein ACR2RL_25215, partial [Gammaproteobacteria bacterium]